MADFLDLVNYYIVEEWMVDHRPLTEKHMRERRRVNAELIGNLNHASAYAPEVARVAAKVGAPPAWFNAGGVTAGQVAALGSTVKARRA